jgi:hypothetical protein
MKRMTYFVMALAMLLGLAQCKKEKLETPQNEGNSVMITLNVNGDASTGSANKGTRVNVDPNDNPMVTFEKGDKIEVACDGHHVGTLTHNGDNFIGDVTNVTVGQYLYFYFFGNVSPQYFGQNKNTCTVYIGDQTGDLPVISMGKSDQLVTSNGRVYSATLQNKCSLMKFNVTNETDDPICINGMNNFLNVNFDPTVNDAFSYSQVYNGEIKMKGQVGSGTKTYWAIVLPQASVAEGGAYTEDHTSIGARPAIGEIEPNKCYIDGVGITMIFYDPIGTPLTFEAKEGGATVILDYEGAAPEVSLQANINGGGWTTYNGNTISLAEGETVMFRGTNSRYATSDKNYNYFSLTGECYVYGNIMSLINETGYADPDDPTQLGSALSYHFANLFHGCTGLYNHPQKTLELPSTTLGSYCYAQMFWGCTNLTRAPELDSEELKENCYEGMFYGCSSLTATPELGAGTLVSYCYSNMFNDCINLRRVTCFAYEGFNQSNCTGNWLSGVADRGTFIKSSYATSWTTGPNGIPDGWAIEQ